MVVFSTLIRFVLGARSHRAAGSLEAMVSTTATVLRHNRATASVGQPAEPRLIEIPLRRVVSCRVVSCRVVSDDIVVLSAEDMVPPTAAFYWHLVECAHTGCTERKSRQVTPAARPRQQAVTLLFRAIATAP
jgi:magnesium-transporting ATPase (P-type)